MKTCFKCNQELPLDCFYKHSKMADGYLGKCKECTKRDVIKNRMEKINYYRAYDRKRGCRMTKQYASDYRKNNPNKYRATNMVSNAIRDGKLFREPCQVCGDENTHAHHDDYLKPLNVRWFCAAHHKQWHVLRGEGANG